MLTWRQASMARLNSPDPSPTNRYQRCDVWLAEVGREGLPGAPIR